MNPQKRIEIICTQLFPLIYCDYSSGFSDYDFALNKLDKYREIAHQLAQEFKPHDKEIEQLEICYSKFKDAIQEKYKTTQYAL